jgi:hypothetical protein
LYSDNEKIYSIIRIAGEQLALGHIEKEVA